MVRETILLETNSQLGQINRKKGKSARHGPQTDIGTEVLSSKVAEDFNNVRSYRIFDAKLKAKLRVENTLKEQAFLPV